MTGSVSGASTFAMRLPSAAVPHRRAGRDRRPDRPERRGKSSTLHAIWSTAPVAAGDILLGGSSLLGRKPEDVARSGIALVPEGRRIFASSSVGETHGLSASAGPALWRPARRSNCA